MTPAAAVPQGQPTPDASAVAVTPRASRLLYAAVLGGLVLVYAPTVLWLFQRWTISVWQHAHGLFIPPLVGWLVVQELKRHRHLPVASSAWGFALLVPALFLHVLDTGIQTQLLSAVSLVIALPGLALLFLGWPRTQRILFPLLFFGFALPIPLALTEQLHLVLRQVTTALVTPLLSATGVSLFTQGTTVYFANATVEIADACSGFSTLYASMAFAFLLAYFSSITKRRILVLAIAGPVAVAANLLRMFILLQLVVWQGPWVLDTFIHPLSGMLTFAIALPLLLWIGSDPPIQHVPAATAPSGAPA
jgi:exosortase